MLDKIIKNVLELPGVEGACILDKKGVILLNALPDFFLDDFLEDLSRRVIALYEAVDENYVPCDDYLLKYPQKYIQLRRSRNVYLLVAVDPSVNLVSLRMVTNLVLKHITPKTLSLLRSVLAVEPVAENDEVPTEVPAAPKAVEPEKTAPIIAPEKTAEAVPPKKEESNPPSSGGVRRVPRPRPVRSFRGAQY